MTGVAQAPPRPGSYADLPPGLTPVERAIYAAAEPYLKTRHNDLHVQLSCQFALAILAQEGGDRRIVVPGVMLHDLGWSEIPEERQRTAYGPYSSDAGLNRLHEEAGARLARGVLEDLGYPEAEIGRIVAIIATHDSKREADSLEEAIVKDADKFYRICTLGFRVNLEDFQVIPPQELHDFIAARADRWFLTPTGLRLARTELEERRREFGLRPAPPGPPPAGDGIGDMRSTGKEA